MIWTGVHRDLILEQFFFTTEASSQLSHLATTHDLYLGLILALILGHLVDRTTNFYHLPVILGFNHLRLHRLPLCISPSLKLFKKFNWSCDKIRVERDVTY